MKNNKPESEEEVFEVMQGYCQKKKYLFSDVQLRFLAENCYLFYEGKGWAGCKYWPAWVMKWILNERNKFSKSSISYKKSKPQQGSYAKRQGKSVRDILLEQEDEV